jgi:Cys-rich protein (TIGR01571 family)
MEGREPSGEWNHGLCECGAVPWSTCLISGCFCVVCQRAKIHSYLLKESPPRVCSTLPCLIAYLGIAVAPLIVPIYGCYLRTQLKEQLGIEESACETCVISTVCSGGSTVQMTMTLVNDLNVPAYVFMVRR